MMKDRGAGDFTRIFPTFDASLFLALILGLSLRLALWGRLPRLGFVGDEAEYLAAADWLAHGREFAWHLQYLWTRAPLYPLFLAAHLALFGGSQTPIFVSQTILSLLNVILVYVLATHVTSTDFRKFVPDCGLILPMRIRWPGSGGRPPESGHRPPNLGHGDHDETGKVFSEPYTSDRQPTSAAPGIAAILTAICLPLASYGQLLLSETLFTSLLLAALVMLGVWTRRGGWLWLAGAGVLLGLATLTRGLTLGFLPLVTGWVWWMAGMPAPGSRLPAPGPRPPAPSPRPPGRWLAVMTVILAAGVIIAPWTLYASRTYGGLVLVDTTGAFNLALGARTAYDSGRNDAPLRNFTLALLDPTLSESQRRDLLADPKSGSCLFAANDKQMLSALATPPTLITQADRQRLLSAEAFCLLRATPGAFVTKSLGELIDLFQINYTGDERLSKGFALGRLPRWYALALFLLDDTLYVLALPLAIIGWALLRRRGAGDRLPASGPRPPAPGPRPPAPRGSGASLQGLWLLYNLGTAPLLFAINRFRVPLLPLLFVLAAYAMANLPHWGELRTRYGAACVTLAGLLLLVAATPYAYLEPRAPGAPARWASYLGPYPSSLESTRLALIARSGYLAEQHLASTLGAGDVAASHEALVAPALLDYAAAVGAPLLDGLEGRPTAGLDRLASGPVQPLENWQRSLIAGELFRQLGDLDAARRELNPSQVDDQNPVEWAWQWLHPPPLLGNRIDSADDNDLGYIRGFYLGRYDADLRATVRWATGDSALRFPHAASGNPQQLCLSMSGLGWPQDLALPTLAVALDSVSVGTIALTRELSQVCLDLPAQPVGTNLTVTLHSSATFVPDALDLVRQQGPQVGQLRRLAYQLDWAEVRER